MPTLFYKIILFILHCIANIFEFLHDISVHIKYKLQLPPNDNASVFSEITKQTKFFNKLPKHITILLGTEEPSYKSLTNIALWSIAAGIPFVSFYDYKGRLKESEALFQDQIKNEKNLDDHIIWHNTHKGTYKNGYVGRKIHIKVLSPNDGKAQFAKLCKKFSQEEVDIEKISIQSLDTNLREYYEFPDPDLAIFFGKTLSMYDYPPWQISVTEFLNIQSHHNMHHKQFIDVLSRYSKCE
ncbi:hypothetical protein AMK59_8314, partial [Oryctes borbonicus]